MSLVRPLLAALALFALAAPADAAIIAYNVPAGTVGNQTFGGSLGMDFNVASSPIRISALGVFDSGSNGLSMPISVAIFDRVTQAIVGPTVTFPVGTPGTLIGGSRFLPVAPFDLPAGFQGSIVAWGYGATEPNGNQGAGALPGLTTNGSGLISFVGGGRFNGTPGAFPSSVDGGPANRYAAGTFAFDAATVPEPATLAVFAAAAGVAGVGVRRRKVAA